MKSELSCQLNARNECLRDRYMGFWSPAVQVIALVCIISPGCGTSTAPLRGSAQVFNLYSSGLLGSSSNTKRERVCECILLNVPLEAKLLVLCDLPLKKNYSSYLFPSNECNGLNKHKGPFV